MIRYQYLLTLLGVALALFGLVHGAWFLAAAWAGGNFIVLGVAHWCGWHRLFGKRTDGTLPTWSWIVFLPLLGFSAGVFHLLRLFSREAAYNAISKRLVVGRRLLGKELQGDFQNIIDLTAEFSEPASIRRSPAYRSFPILDGGAPNPEVLRKAVESLRAGRTFVHCAQGHGRSGLFALAVLLSSGEASNIEDGMQMLRAARPAICLSREQWDCVRILSKDLGRP